MILKYEVPKKDGDVAPDYVVNWMALRDELLPITEQTIIDNFSKHGKKIDRWDVKIKVDNTIKFHNFVKQAFDQKQRFINQLRPK